MRWQRGCCSLRCRSTTRSRARSLPAPSERPDDPAEKPVAPDKPDERPIEDPFERDTIRYFGGGGGVAVATRDSVLASEPGLAKQNGITLGRVLGSGNVMHAEEGADGRMHATIRINEDELVFDPGILILPHGGIVDLDIYNDDNNTHCAVFPSNGHSQFIWLVNHSHGTAPLELDGPGQYWYGSTTGNDEGGGLTGSIVVGGRSPRRLSSIAQPSHDRRPPARRSCLVQRMRPATAG